MVPHLATPHLVVGHAASALGMLEGTLNEMACGLLFREMTHGSTSLGIVQTHLERRPARFPAHQELPALRRRRLAGPYPNRLGEALGDSVAFLTAPD